MTDAEEIRAALRVVAETLSQARDSGTLATANVQDTISQINDAVIHLLDSRNHATRQIESLKVLAKQIEAIAERSLNADLVDSLNKIYIATKDVTEYRDRIQFQINNLQKISAVIRMQLQPLIETPTKVLLTEVDQILEQYALGL